MTAFLWSLFAYAGWIALLAAGAPAIRRKPALAGAIVLIAAWPAAWMLRGMFADPSPVTASLVWAVAFLRFRHPASPAPRVFSTAPAIGIIGLAAILYASAIGPLAVDLYYVPGHEQGWIAPLAFAPVAWLSFRAGDIYGRTFPIAALIAISGIQESHNAWDGFIDPALPLIAMVELLRNRRRRAADPTGAHSTPPGGG